MAAPNMRSSRSIQAFKTPFSGPDLAGSWRLEPRKNPQQRRFAAAAATHDGDELAAPYIQINVTEDLSVAELLRQTADA
jgi:hypothetical protein